MRRSMDRQPSPSRASPRPRRPREGILPPRSIAKRKQEREQGTGLSPPTEQIDYDFSWYLSISTHSRSGLSSSLITAAPTLRLRLMTPQCDKRPFSTRDSVVHLPQSHVRQKVQRPPSDPDPYEDWTRLTSTSWCCSCPGGLVGS